MQIKSKKICFLELTENELEIIVRGVSQRLQGWSRHHIENYKKQMEDSKGPQHYFTGYEKFLLFIHEFKKEFEVWDNLVGGERGGLSGPAYSHRPAYDLIEYKRGWLRQFQEIQDEYDNRKTK